MGDRGFEWLLKLYIVGAIVMAICVGALVYWVLDTTQEHGLKTVVERIWEGPDD